jgi:hypothetical protein
VQHASLNFATLPDGWQAASQQQVLVQGFRTLSQCEQLRLARRACPLYGMWLMLL